MDAALVAPGEAAIDLRTAAIDLLAREEPILRRVMGRYVHDVHAVDDLYQEVSLKALRRLDAVREPAALRGWIYMMARNACLDWIRARDRDRAARGAVLAETPDASALGRNPVEQFLSAERLDAVRRALDRLPSSQRETIRLRIEDGLDHDAIAARLGISRTAVEVRLCRGRSALKAQLDAILGGDL
jgi:RNA polymerase sigma-70 factor, ECF subfamily